MPFFPVIRPGIRRGFSALIGEGDVDSLATLRTLKDLKYDGFINIEYENNKYPADEAVRRALDYLRA